MEIKKYDNGVTEISMTFSRKAINEYLGIVECVHCGRELKEEDNDEICFVCEDRMNDARMDNC